MKHITLQNFGDRVIVLMPTLMQEMWRYERGFFQRGEITFPQLWALTYLEGKESCTMRELARAMKSRESTTSGLADRMAALGLIKRQRDRADRRVVHASLTAKGRSLIKELQRQRRRAFMSLFKRVSAAERLRWLEIIEKLVREMSPDKAKD